MSLYYINPNTRWNSYLLSFDNINFLKDNQIIIKNKPKNNVKFAEVCRVVLVPKREEYTAAGIQLWWSITEFHQFKKDRYLELTQQLSSSSSSSSSTTLLLSSSTTTTNEEQEEQRLSSQVNIPKSLPSFEINLRILICTTISPMKCNYLTNLSKYLWSEENPSRSATYLSIHYTTPSQLSTIISDNSTQYNIIILDKSNGHYSGIENVTCQIIRQYLKLAIIISIMQNEAAIQSNDDCSIEQADLLLPTPQIPSLKQWKELIELLIERMECSDFLPSPLVQHYITAI